MNASDTETNLIGTNQLLLQSPVLLPTISDKPRMDYESVKDYFDGFLLKKPQGKNLETIFIICNIFRFIFNPHRLYHILNL